MGQGAASPDTPAGRRVMIGRVKGDRLMKRQIARVLPLLTLIGWFFSGGPVHADSSALWRIAHDLCVPGQRAHADPSPCAEVDEAAGYVILKDKVGATQFLLIATARIAGIESPEILSLEAPNYWDLAWRARHHVEDRLGRALPRDMLSLAINSRYGRGQDQLHIHIDCLRADVRAALRDHQRDIGVFWSDFPVPLTGRSWRAIRVDGKDLAAINPFRLLAGEAGGDMAKHTLVVAGVTGEDERPGFAVLDDAANLLTLNRASGERLQDHDCAVAR